ncbi:MAG TPA: type VI secretion system baseplate subunit TssE [Marinagarivorans sp.]
MNPNDKKQLLAPLMDRLLNDSKTASYARPQAVIAQIRESVRRDLESLFNSRSCNRSPSRKYPHLQKSLLNFGLPDLSTINFSSKDDRKRFCSQVETAIKHYEPRVKSAKVCIGDKVDVEDPTIRFRVEAVLHVSPADETIIFDSAFNPISHSVDISEIS